jgi:hypothetical protein
MPNYWRTRAQDVEDIRSTLKHVDLEDISLPDIRDRLGPIVSDLQTLQSLRRPKSYKLTQLDDAVVQVEIIMELDQDDAEDMVRKLWLEAD